MVPNPLHIIVSTLIVASICVDFIVVDAQVEFDSFDGRIGKGSSSWFESKRWKGLGRVPTLNDSVWIDESNTYAAIDDKSLTARVMELIVGRSSSSNSLGSVQLDLLKDTKLLVQQDMTIGEKNGSDGAVYAQDGSKISVGGVLTVGSQGNGILVLSGSAKIQAKNLKVRNKNQNSGSRIVMGDESQLVIKGDKRRAVNRMISNGLIVTELMESRMFKVGKKRGNTLVIVKVKNDEEPSCENRKLKYKGKKKKNCVWVKKKKGRRCDLTWKNEFLRDWCPKSCNTLC
jgi:hypothetical protein|uniref:ShKT domain-containing protein n=1 Tax=Pseudo-nitzschia australis TaxID=44445 RepID=A0A7S4ERB3_9STRA|mmetsp:Transcript_20895/g.44079  ORF Transcript_20895/g.44079 Transcript_20895/m.44079 type:complete len:287 (+) Transcript_20895:213-1073(+)